MCGIACVIDYGNKLNSSTLINFTNAVAHRGPDDFRFEKFANDKPLSITNRDNCFIGFGHRRLSILDLTDAGAQPMFAANNRYVIVYNGEVYNYKEIKKELEKEGAIFHSNCDTEVVLEAYRFWGKECLKHFNGMWAFVILDREQRKLFISRDRLGIKPLYYYQKGKIFAIASEIKQFFSLPGFSLAPNKPVCLSYLTTGYEIPPQTFFKNIFAFPSARYAEISIDSFKISPQKYWFYENISINKYNIGEAIAEIQKRFYHSVKLRLIADVPVGGCLSGGLDSSSIFFEMKKINPLKSFTAFSACFNEPKIDERQYMASVIKQTSNIHYQIFPKAELLAEDIENFLIQHDEPVGSVSVYAQYKVMQAARKIKIPVLLDGQGGDELFSGYWPSYFLMLNYHRKIQDYSFIINHLTGALTPKGNFSLIYEAFSHFKEYRKRALRKLPFELSPKYTQDLESLTWHFAAQDLSPANYRIAEIFKIHLPRLLKWEDRNSMAYSIESRVPFLDVNLVELLLSIPPEMNIKKGWNKYLFRRSMEKKLPKSICWRKDKKGFETPQDKWMKEGAFNEYLLNWALKKEHPVSDFVITNFKKIHDTIFSKQFDTRSMFRLFNLDSWLKFF